MGLKDLVSKTIKHAVTRSDGIGERVFYTSQDGRYSLFPCSAIVEANVEEDVIGKEDKEFTLFHGVHLDQLPAAGDSIKFQDKVYTYHRTVDQFGDAFDVLAFIKKNVIGRSRR